MMFKKEFHEVEERTSESPLELTQNYDSLVFSPAIVKYSFCSLKVFNREPAKNNFLVIKQSYP